MKRVKRESKRPSYLRSSQFEIDDNILKKERYERQNIVCSDSNSDDVSPLVDDKSPWKKAKKADREDKDKTERQIEKEDFLLKTECYELPKTECSDSEKISSDNASPPHLTFSSILSSEKAKETGRKEEEISRKPIKVSDKESPEQEKDWSQSLTDTSQTNEGLFSSDSFHSEVSCRSGKVTNSEESDGIDVIGDSQSSIEHNLSFRKEFQASSLKLEQEESNIFKQFRFSFCKEGNQTTQNTEKKRYHLSNEQKSKSEIKGVQDGTNITHNNEKKDTQTSEGSASSGEISFKSPKDSKHEHFNELSENDFVSDEHLVSDSYSEKASVKKKEEQEEIKTESETSSIKDEDCKDDKQFSLKISQKEWLKFTGVESQSTCGLGKGWTDCIYEHFKKINPKCCLVFKYNRLRKEKSRKKNAPYFRAKANCRFKGCTSYLFLIKDVPNEGEDIEIDVEQFGTIRHEKGVFHKRHLTGEKRKDIVEAAKQMGPSTVHYEKLSNMPSDAFSSGNLTDATTKDVIRKALSESTITDRLHKDSFCGMILLQDVLHQEDDESQHVKGYIQFLSYEPFLAIMYTENQILMLKEKVKMGQAQLYLDATGSIVTNMNDKRVLYYALTMKAEEKGIPPLPVSEMLSTDQTTVAISLFLLKTLHSLKKIQPEPMVNKVEIDFSWAMINSVIRTFANMSVSDYIREAWRSYLNMQDFHHTVAHVCCFHTLKRFQERISKFSKDLELKKFIAFCFGLLINSSDPPTARALWRDIHLTLSHGIRCTCVRRAIGKLNARIATMSHVDEDVKSEITITDFEESVQDSTQKSSLRAKSPFYKYFKHPSHQCLCEETTLNEYQSLEALAVIKDYLPLYPLWSGMLLSSVTSKPTRDSTSVAENWFRIVKNDIFQKKKKVRPAVFVRKVHLSLKGRLRQHKMSAMKVKMKKTKEPWREKSPVLSEEKWGHKRQETDKKKQQSKFFSPPPKIPKPKLKKSRDQVSSKGAVLSNKRQDLKDGHVGLVNRRNSCWLNSSAQMFLLMLSQTDFNLLKQRPVKHAVSSRFLSSLEHLVRNQPGIGTVEEILDLFRDVDGVDIDPGQQNDAAAFIEFMLLELVAINIQGTVDLSYTNACIRCDKVTSSTQDTVFLWHVELPNHARKPIDVQSCLDEYLKTETLIEANALWCDRCILKTPHLRSANLIVAPKHVFIQLKRFNNQLRKEGLPIVVNRNHTSIQRSSCSMESGVNNYVNLAVKEDSILVIDDSTIIQKPDSYLTSTYVKTGCYILMYKADTNVTSTNKPKQEEDDAKRKKNLEESETDTDEEPLYESAGLTLTKGDLKRLDQSKELNDNVINCYFKLLETTICEMHQDKYFVCCMDTFFYNAAKKEDMADIRKWAAVKNWQYCTYIVFPVHINNHWTVLICHVKDGWLMSYDSMGFHHSTIVQKISQLIKNFSPATSLRLNKCKSSPQQKNNVDCGVFVCAFVKRFLFNDESNFNQTDIPWIREDMKVELTSQKIIP